MIDGWWTLEVDRRELARRREGKVQGESEDVS